MTEAGLNKIMAMIRLAKSGYAGVTPEGRIVDRRERPDCLPIPENEYLGVPAPRLFPVSEKASAADSED